MSIDEIISSGENITIAVKAADLVEFAENIAARIINGLNSTEKEEKYLTVHEAAQKLRVDKSTILRWNKTGYLCHVEVGGRRLYKQSDIDAVLISK